MNSPPSEINYDELMHGLRISLVRQILEQVSIYGLIGSHFFQLTINTRESGVEVPSYLLSRYPEQMMIILQHRFENLTTNDKGFGVTLYFQDCAEKIFVPWDSVLVFQDPSVPFGLQIKHYPHPLNIPIPEKPSSHPTISPSQSNKPPLKVLPTEKGRVLTFESRRDSDKTSKAKTPPQESQ